MNNSVADMTVDELKRLVHAAVRDALQELLPDPDAGLELREDVIDFLRESLAADRQESMTKITASQVAAELGLDW
jgi:hypothetical protein